MYQPQPASRGRIDLVAVGTAVSLFIYSFYLIAAKTVFCCDIAVLVFSVMPDDEFFFACMKKEKD